MWIDTLSSRPDIYASLEAYWLKSAELEKLFNTAFDKYAKSISIADRQKAVEQMMKELILSAKKLDIYRERRNFYMDSEGKLEAQFWKDERAKNAFLLKEIVENMIDTEFIPWIALLERASRPRTGLGRFLYDSELFVPFQKEITRLDSEYGLSVWWEILAIQNAWWNIADESNRKKIYEWIVAKLKPAWSPWILQMLKHGNWKAMSWTRWYTDVQIGAPNDPRSDVVEIIQMYEAEIENFIRKNGELYKMRVEFQKKWTLPSETRYFGNVIPALDPRKANVEWKLNTVHYLLFKWFGWQGIENAIVWMSETGKPLSWTDRLMSAWEWLIDVFMWSKLMPNSWKFDAFGNSVEAVLKTSNALEKAQILAFLTRIFGAKSPLIKKLASI